MTKTIVGKAARRYIEKPSVTGDAKTHLLFIIERKSSFYGSYSLSQVSIPSHSSIKFLEERKRLTTSLPSATYKVVFANFPVSKKEDWFSKYKFVLERLAHLLVGWDSYDAEPPNHIALCKAEVVLNYLFELNFAPDRVTPSVEGGVGISFLAGEKYADVECFNSGEILAVISDRKAQPDVWELSNAQEIKLALTNIRAFINR